MQFRGPTGLGAFYENRKKHNMPRIQGLGFSLNPEEYSRTNKVPNPTCDQRFSDPQHRGADLVQGRKHTARKP